MQLAGDPLALAADGQVAQLELEPVGLDRDRGLAGERGEGAAVVVGRPRRAGSRTTASVPIRSSPRSSGVSRTRSGRRPRCRGTAVERRRCAGRAAPRAEPDGRRRRRPAGAGRARRQQPPGVVDDRPEDLVEIGDGGDLDAHLVERPRRRVPGLELGVPCPQRDRRAGRSGGTRRSRTRRRRRTRSRRPRCVSTGNGRYGSRSVSLSSSNPPMKTTGTRIVSQRSRVIGSRAIAAPIGGACDGRPRRSPAAGRSAVRELVDAVARGLGTAASCGDPVVVGRRLRGS